MEYQDASADFPHASASVLSHCSKSFNSEGIANDACSVKKKRVLIAIMKDNYSKSVNEVGLMLD